MTHAEFVSAWREGKVAVAVDPADAAVFLSARLLLPFVATGPRTEVPPAQKARRQALARWSADR